MPNKLKIEYKLSGRIVMVVAFAILALGVASGSWGWAYGFGQTRDINPSTGRPHGEPAVHNTYDAGKVNAQGITLEPTKILKREVVPAVQYHQDANSSAKAAPQGKPIVIATPVPARTPVGEIKGTTKVVKPEAKSVTPAQTTKVAKPEAKPVAPAQTTKVAKPEAKPVAPAQTTKVAKPEAKPVAPAQTTKAAKPEAKPVAPAQTTKVDPANVKPSLAAAPVKDPVEKALSDLKSQDESKGDSQPSAQAGSAEAKADSPSTAVVPGSPADQAVEWAMSGWKEVVSHRQSHKPSSQAGVKSWSVARAVGDKNETERVSGSAQAGTPAAQSQTGIAAPLPVAGNKSVSEKAQREAFLTQPPKPLASSVRSGGTESLQSKPNGSASGPAVNYGGKLAGVESGPNDIVLTDAIVEIPKGEGFEAMISACGQGLLVELGIEELGKDGKPVLDEQGQPKRISLKRGMAVRKGQILGKQNDREHAANKLVAEQQLIVAKKEAEKQLEIEVARLAVQVAESEYLRAQSANEKVPGAVSPEEVVQKAYEWKRADKSAEKAVYDLGVKSDEVEVRKAQVVAADAQVLDRKLVSPIDGFVDDVMQNEGQWLREGDNILKIIRLDKVQICGKIDANLFSPEMVDRKPVTIYVQKPGGPLQKVQGTITYARQVVESGKFYIYAEASNVANAQGYWLLNPGTIVTMVIHR